MDLTVLPAMIVIFGLMVVAVLALFYFALQRDRPEYIIVPVFVFMAVIILTQSNYRKYGVILTDDQLDNFIISATVLISIYIPYRIGRSLFALIKRKTRQNSKSNEDYMGLINFGDGLVLMKPKMGFDLDAPYLTPFAVMHSKEIIKTLVAKGFHSVSDDLYVKNLGIADVGVMRTHQDLLNGREPSVPQTVFVKLL